MDWLLQINEKVHAVVWGPVTLLLLLGIGL